VDYRVRILQEGIAQRQRELHNVAEILGHQALKRGRLAAGAKVVTIVFGAIAATQGVAAQLVGSQSVFVLVPYTLIGLVIAAVAGIDAAFKLESRSAELTLLAAECQSIIWQIDSAWQQTVGTVEGEERIAAARALLTKQDAGLAEVQKRSAQLGVNITLQVRELYVDEPPAMA
jgi:hypothetical protein